MGLVWPPRGRGIGCKVFWHRAGESKKGFNMISLVVAMLQVAMLNVLSENSRTKRYSETLTRMAIMYRALQKISSAGL